MTRIFFTALEKFSKKNGDDWDKYIKWSKLSNVNEIISLDSMLCPTAIPEYSDEDWEYQSEEIKDHGIFTDLSHVLKKGFDLTKIQIIALVRNPVDEVWRTELPKNFVYKGYDLIDDETLISALSNCGGFPETFSDSELNSVALISSLNRALKIQNDLKINNPKEAHANCSIYGLARLEE